MSEKDQDETTSAAQVCKSIKHFTLEDVLERIGISWAKVFALVAICASYGSFMANNLLPTFVNEDLKLLWPRESANKPYYNLIFACQALARLLGSIFFIPLQDLIGRKNQLLWFSSLLALFTVATPFCLAFWSYVLIHYFASLFAAVLPSTAQVFCIEILPANHRAGGSILLQMWQVLQTVIISAVNLGLSNLDSTQVPMAWQYLYAFSAIFPLLSVIIFLILRLETPRYEASRGNQERTWKQFCRLTKGGEKGLTQLLNVENIYTLSLEVGQYQLSSPSAFTEIIKNNFTRMWIVSCDKTLRSTTIPLCCLWAFTAIAFWGFTTYMTTFYSYIGLNSKVISFFCSMVQIPGFALVWYLMQRSETLGGRIVTLRLCSITCVTGLLGLVLVSSTSLYSERLLFFFALWTYMFTNPMWGVVYSYSSEVYPTSYRGAAMGLFGTVNALCTFATTFVGSISLSESNVWLYPLIWAGFYFAAALVTTFLHKESQMHIAEDQYKYYAQHERDKFYIDTGCTTRECSRKYMSPT